MAAYGNKLNPRRAARIRFGVKGERTTVVNTNNPATINAGETLSVWFPRLGDDEVIVPGSARLAFNLALTNGTTPAADLNRTVVKNVGRALVKTLRVKLAGNEMQVIDDYDVYMLYKDLVQLSDKERNNASYQGIAPANQLAIRISAGNAVAATQPDASIAAAFGNRFCIPLDFELLTDHLPHYQAGLDDQLCVELVFNDYGRVVRSTATNVTYVISGLALEYDKVTNRALAAEIRREYTSFICLFSRVISYQKVTQNKQETSWPFVINTAIKSLKGVLFLWEDPAAGASGPAFGRDSEYFFNPVIQKASVSVNGNVNQLFTNGMAPYMQWGEVSKLIREELKDAELSATDHLTFFQNRFGLWLDFRSCEDNTLHGSGRNIDNAVGGITITLERNAQAAAPLNCYVYLLMDAQLNIANGKFHSVVY